jgi:hypothetical protein
MAKKKIKQDQSEPSAKEQLDLIDVKPENSKEMLVVAKRYKTAQAQRIEALGREVAEKQKLLALIKEANLQHLDDGKIQFRIDRLIVTVTPRDELIRIKDENENNDEEADKPGLPGTEGQ